MSTKLKAWREERGELHEEMEAICGRYKDSEPWTPEDEKRWESLNAKYEELSAKIKNEERLATVTTRGADLAQPANRPPPPPAADGRDRAPFASPSREAAVESVALRRDETCEEHVLRSLGNPRLEEHELLSPGEVIRAFLRGPKTDLERRALSEGTDSAGGFTVPDILSSRIIDLLRVRTHVLRAGAQLVPIKSDSHAFAKLTSDPAGTWRAENAAVTESDPTVGRVLFLPKTFAVVVRASRELIEDSLNIKEMLENALARSFSAEIDRVALVGSGASNEPLGISGMTNAQEVSMGTNGAAITDYTEILDLLQKLQEANADAPTAAILAPRTSTTIGKFADTTGQPLSRPGPLTDLPFLVTNQVPIDQTQGTSTDASSIYMGNFSELWIGMRTEFRLQILRERYSDNLQIGFLAYMRADVQAAHEESLGRLVGIIP